MTEPTWYSQSSLSKHRECPQKWFYSYEKGLSKIEDGTDVAVHRDFGSWWHALRAADALMRGRTHASLKVLPKRLTTVDEGPIFDPQYVTVKDVLEAARMVEEAASQEVRDEWVAALGEGLHDRLSNLYDRWQDQWQTEIAEERPLAVEMGWGRNLSPAVRLVGYIDEIYLDTRRNIVVVRDHKSGKALNTQTTADDMMDSQLQFYAWGASPAVTEWGVGKIMATAYDRARSVKAKTPVVTQSGTLSKSITDFDLYTYLQWSAGEDGQGVPFPGRTKDGSQAGLYTAEESQIERLSSPAASTVWFQRTLTPLNSNLVRTHLRAALDGAEDMERSRLRSAETGEAARNMSSWTCRWCDYAGLCRAQMVGGPDGEYDLADFKLRKKSSK